MNAAIVADRLAERSRVTPVLAARVAPPLFLVLLVYLAIGQFLHVGLVSTDWWPVVSTNHVESVSDVLRAFQEPIGAGDPHFIAETARHYRPLATLSFALDYHLWGLNPAGWQLTNFLVHLGVTLGVYALARTLGLARWASLMAAAIFTLHPVIVATEPAIARRHDTLSALFLLPGLVLLLRGSLVVPAVLFAVSILSKETSLAALPFVPLLMRYVGQPMTRTLALVPAAIFAVGIRVLAIGDLGGYGTASVPSVGAWPIYWDRIGKYFTDLVYPAPARPGMVALLVMVLVVAVVGGCALLLPRRERALTLVGLLWVFGFAVFYAALKVYAGSWYLYIPLVGLGLGLAAIASGAWERRAWLPLGVATLATGAILIASPLVRPYPDWAEATTLIDGYLARVDTCTEDGNPPLYTTNETRQTVFISPTALLDYSVNAYIALRYPNGRPCQGAA